MKKKFKWTGSGTLVHNGKSYLCGNIILLGSKDELLRNKDFSKFLVEQKEKKKKLKPAKIEVTTEEKEEKKEVKENGSRRYTKHASVDSKTD